MVVYDASTETHTHMRKMGISKRKKRENNKTDKVHKTHKNKIVAQNVKSSRQLISSKPHKFDSALADVEVRKQ